MTTPRSIDSYGGVFADAFPVEDPTTEISATYDNRLHEDVAQMSATTIKVIAKFLTIAAAAPQTAAATSERSHGNFLAPSVVVTKTGTGEYTLTWPTTFTDALGVVETLALSFSHGDKIASGTPAHVETFPSGSNTIDVYVYDMAGAATDLGGNEVIQVWGM